MTTSFDRLSTGTAELSAEDAIRLVGGTFGIDATDAEPLWGEVDLNFLIDAEAGRFVLKVASTNAVRSDLGLQNIALHRLRDAGIGAAVPAVVDSVDGQDIAEVVLATGTHFVRLITFVEGMPIRDLEHRSDGLLRELGAVAGRIVGALAEIDHPAADRTHHWDMRHVVASVRSCLPSVDDPVDREAVERILSWIDDDTLERLPRALVHQDLNDHNVFVAPDGEGRHRISAVIDIGDALRTIRVAELAIAAGYAMRDAPDPVACVATITGGYVAEQPLLEEEADVLFALAAARLCCNVTTWTRRQAAEPDNAYARDRMRGSWEVIRAIASMDPAFATAAIRSACGLEPNPARRILERWIASASFTPVLDVASVPVLDLSPDGDIFDAADPADAEAVRAMVTAARPAVALYGAIDLTRAGRHNAATVRLGTECFVAAGTKVVAPADGTVERADADRVVVRHAPVGGPVFWSVYSGSAEVHVSAQQTISAGEPLGDAGEGGLTVQLACSVPATATMLYARPGMRKAAMSIFVDPAPLLGREPVAVASPQVDDILATRDIRFATSQKSYYRRPPNLVRARGVWLYDEDGRAFLDAVNNVTHVGHGHPKIVEAAHRQLHRLNTNSRFVYGALADYADRLASKLPAPLEVVFLACTGSEANDLALRIARTVTGNEAVVTIDGAYHGNTTAVTAVSPNRYKMIGEDAPPLTIEIPQPNRYRGEFGYDDPAAGAKYASQAATCIAASVADGNPPAAAITESLMGTAGEIVHPAGFLAELFRLTREAGGLCISDEVQVGFGRLGHTFWGFQMHDVVPDIVTMGKPIGNGFPMSAVVTTREIADAFDNGMRYFNTFGGNPVACAVGMAVLDVVEEEGLQEAALQTGAYLFDRLRDVASRHELVGDVRGEGLYAGIELVRDRGTKEYATQEAFRISERMKEEGVIVYPNGRYDNILKLKPPMVFGARHVDIVADTLDHVLRAGW